MSRQDRYPIARGLRQLCRLLDLSEENVLRRAGLPSDYLANETRGVTTGQYFKMWAVIFEQARRHDLPLHLGKLLARGPFNSAIFAFSCSPDVATGLRRLALFKPLVGPVRMTIRNTADLIRIQFDSIDTNQPLPIGFQAFELVYFLELVRFHTGEEIVPYRVELGGTAGPAGMLEEYFGTPVHRGNATALSLTTADALLPLVTENAELWDFFEKHLQQKLADRERQTPIVERVRNTLLEMLPAGMSSIDAVSERLHLSRRSLQRRLSEEGKSYQVILDEIRSELSLYYLSRDGMSIEEISFLLAYRDPNSFYRAFHGWTGMTPQEARSQGRS